MSQLALADSKYLDLSAINITESNLTEGELIMRIFTAHFKSSGSLAYILADLKIKEYWALVQKNGKDFADNAYNIVNVKQQYFESQILREINDLKPADCTFPLIIEPDSVMNIPNLYNEFTWTLNVFANQFSKGKNSWKAVYKNLAIHRKITQKTNLEMADRAFGIDKARIEYLGMQESAREQAELAMREMQRAADLKAQNDAKIHKLVDEYRGIKYEEIQKEMAALEAHVKQQLAKLILESRGDYEAVVKDIGKFLNTTKCQVEQVGVGAKYQVLVHVEIISSNEILKAAYPNIPLKMTVAISTDIAQITSFGIQGSDHKVSLAGSVYKLSKANISNMNLTSEVSMRDLQALGGDFVRALEEGQTQGPAAAADAIPQAPQAAALSDRSYNGEPIAPNSHAATNVADHNPYADAKIYKMNTSAQVSGCVVAAHPDADAIGMQQAAAAIKDMPVIMKAMKKFHDNKTNHPTANYYYDFNNENYTEEELSAVRNAMEAMKVKIDKIECGNSATDLVDSYIKYAAFKLAIYMKVGLDTSKGLVHELLENIATATGDSEQTILLKINVQILQLEKFNTIKKLLTEYVENFDSIEEYPATIASVLDIKGEDGIVKYTGSFKSEAAILSSMPDDDVTFLGGSHPSVDDLS